MIISERERLKTCGFADVYIILYLDVVYQFNSIFSKNEIENEKTRAKVEKED